MAIPIEAEFRKLKKRKRRSQVKYFVLLSNQAVIIDTEWDALSTARKRYPGKRIDEMYSDEA